jgi:diacylglycerol kinase (ATP)
LPTLVIASTYAGGGRGPSRLPALPPGVEVVPAVAAGHARALAAAAGGYDAVVAAGGDGTAHEIVNGLLSLPSPRPALGLIPVGTGNDVARNLGLLSPAAGWAAVVAGVRRPLDIFRIECRRDGRRAVVHGVLNCGIGFGAEVVRRATARVKRLAGPNAAYAWGLLSAMGSWDSPGLTVRSAAGVWRGPTFFLALGNGALESGGTMHLSPGASMSDGLGNLVRIRRGSKAVILYHLARGALADGTFVDLPQVQYVTTPWIEVTAGQPLGIQSDGDVVGATPCRVTVLRSAIEVLAP